MPILIGAKGATISGVNYPPYAYIDWLSPAQEAVAVQGGDAVLTPARGLTPGETDGVRALVSKAWISPKANANNAVDAAYNSSLIQTALSSNADNAIAGSGTYDTGDTVFIDSNSRLDIGSAAKLRRYGTYGKAAIKTSNAHWYGDAAAVPGIAILFASDSAGVDGVGQIRVSGANVYYTAPGDTEGAATAVTVGNALSTGTARYGLASGTATKKLHVCVSQPSLADGTAAVRVHSSSGAQPVTWARTSNITTVTQVAHGRQVGDCVITCGTGLIGQAMIETTPTADTYTFTDSRANSSGVGEVFGRRNIRITGAGAIDLAHTASATLRSVEDAHGIILLGVSDFEVSGVLVSNQIKYGVFAQGVANGLIDVRGYATYASSSTAIVQCNGKARNVTIRGKGKSTDTATALIAGDYPTQTYLLSTDEGSLHFDDVIVENVVAYNSLFEHCRMAGASGVQFRNTKIRNIRGSTDTTAAAMRAVSMIYDAAVHNAGDCIMLGLEIDGVAVARVGANHLQSVALYARGTTLSRGVKVRNIELLNPLVSSGDAFVAFGGPASGAAAFDDVTIEKVFHRSPTWQGNAVASLGAGSCKTLKLIDVQVIIDNALVGTGITSACFTHNAALTFDRIIMDNCAMEEVSAAGSKSDPWLVLSGAGAIGSFSVTRQRTKNNLSMGYWNKSMTGCAVSLTDSEVSHSGTNYGVRFDQPVGSFTVGNIRQFGVIPTDLARIAYTGAVMKCRSLGGLYTPGTTVKHINIATGTSNAPDCHGIDLVCDTTTIAAVQGSLVRSNAATSLLMYRNATVWAEVA